VRSALLLLLLLLLGACRSGSSAPVQRVTPLPNAGEPELHQKIDPKTGQPLHTWSTVAIGGGLSKKQGKEIVLRKDGTKEWEREWERGEPTGLWRSWYANGALRSEVFFAGPLEERPMTFWFDNGQRRMQGPARNGVRCGRWKIWYANGQLAEEGEFVAGRREGEWQAWSEDGQRPFVRTYRHDVRLEERAGELAPK
jgi:antitoxin component YwqK of YwqJK toxin-antitoxin module